MVTLKTKGEYRALELFDSRDWGLIIYDEVHLLPAPIFRMAADLQSRRRLGLTATLVREDGREDDVFSLIGPKRYDAPGKNSRWPATSPPPSAWKCAPRLPTKNASPTPPQRPANDYRLATCSAGKLEVVDKLLATHKGQ